MRLRCCRTTGQTLPASTIRVTTGDAQRHQLIIESQSPGERTLTSWSTHVVRGGRWATGARMADCTTSCANWRTGAVKPSTTRALWQVSTTPRTPREQTRTGVALPTILRLETTF